MKFTPDTTKKKTLICTTKKIHLKKFNLLINYTSHFVGF